MSPLRRQNSVLLIHFFLLIFQARNIVKCFLTPLSIYRIWAASSRKHSLFSDTGTFSRAQCWKQRGAGTNGTGFSLSQRSPMNIPAFPSSQPWGQRPVRRIQPFASELTEVPVNLSMHQCCQCDPLSKERSGFTLEVIICDIRNGATHLRFWNVW